MNVITLIASQIPLEKSHIDMVRNDITKAGATVGEVVWLSPNKAVDIFFDGVSPETAQARVQMILLDYPIDVIAQPVENRRKKMLISDMDSTLIHQECIDELAAFVGLKDKVSEITERAMNGEMCFKEALRERVLLLKGLSETVFEETYREAITHMEGAEVLTRTMRENGAFCLIVSGGFTVFTSRVKEDLGFHHDISNIFKIKDGFLTGEVIEPIHDKTAKLKALNAHAEALEITAEQVVAVGDGANDLPMLLAAGLGIAYHAKPAVKAQAKHSINYNDLTALLFAQGYKEDEFFA